MAETNSAGDRVQEVFAAALHAYNNSYSPYSHYAVGAAVAIRGSNRIFGGTNVENASYGATICAERSAIVAMVSSIGRHTIDIVAVVSLDDPPAVPCAVCLQVLAEFAAPDTLIVVGTPEKGICSEYRFNQLLPYPFTLD